MEKTKAGSQEGLSGCLYFMAVITDIIRFIQCLPCMRYLLFRAAPSCSCKICFCLHKALFLPHSTYVHWPLTDSHIVLKCRGYAGRRLQRALDLVRTDQQFWARLKKRASLFKSSTAAGALEPTAGPHPCTQQAPHAPHISSLPRFCCQHTSAPCYCWSLCRQLNQVPVKPYRNLHYTCTHTKTQESHGRQESPVCTVPYFRLNQDGSVLQVCAVVLTH